MGRLVTSGLTSLDGYIADERGDFSWGEPDAAVHAFVNDLERSIGTYLYGRRMFEVMRGWEHAHEEPDRPEVERDYTSVWQAADKVVFSTSLDDAGTRRTRVERSFDADAVRDLVQSSTRDVSISGPGLAAHAFRAGLVDEVRLFLHPIVVGGGTRFLPDGVRLLLELVEERRFDNGVVFVRYRVR
ncbi:dihydrofolate reductase family protein [Agromyces sp. H66]|uniref:dihydrofolate reductase family protein n=1 Tax=Agromyces sp. H66 TaxID=2529859 RepID=UPI0010AA9CE0|nr:dihydrofolate reductase family protein [Agromyces sp. H66]